MHRPKNILMALALAGFCFLLPAMGIAQESTLRIVVVDLQTALNNSQEGQRAKATIEGFAAAKQGDIAKTEDAIKAARTKLDADAPMLDPDKRMEREQEVQTMILEYQQVVYESQMEMQNMELEMTAKILEKLADMATTVAKERGYDVVLEAGAVVFSVDSMDITNDVITRFNAGK